MSLSIRIGNFLYRNLFFLYRPVYYAFKRKQDKPEIELLQRYVKPGSIVIDIGANIGFYAKIISDLVGRQGQVHCFEPDVQNFEHLKKACASLKNVSVNQLAVGPATEKIKIYTSHELNVDHRTYRPEKFDKEIDIHAISLDDYIDRQKIDLKNISVIKMDIQGFEMQAVQGMNKALGPGSSSVLISEFWPYGLKASGSSATGYFDFLIEKGFECYLINEKGEQLLTPEQVRQMEPQGKQHYYNILVKKKNV